MQWLRISLPMQGTQVRSLAREYPTCHRAAKPVHCNYWACTLEPVSHNYWAFVPQLLKPACPRTCTLLLKLVCSRARVPQLLSLRAATTEAHMPRACALQQEEPPQWEARAPQRRVAPAHRNYRKPMCSNEDPTQPKIKIKLKKKKSSLSGSGSISKFF